MSHKSDLRRHQSLIDRLSLQHDALFQNLTSVTEGCHCASCSGEEATPNFRQMKYTGMPAAMIMKPGQVVAV